MYLPGGVDSKTQSSIIRKEIRLPFLKILKNDDQSEVLCPADGF